MKSLEVETLVAHILMAVNIDQPTNELMNIPTKTIFVDVDSGYRVPQPDDKKNDSFSGSNDKLPLPSRDGCFGH